MCTFHRKTWTFGMVPEEVKRRATRLESLSYEELLKEMRLFSLKRRFWEDFIGDFQYLQRDYKNGGAGGTFSSGSVLIRQGGMLLNLNKIDLDYTLGRNSL